MNLYDTISADIKSAMLAKDRVKLDALRAVKKVFIEAKTAKGSDGELTDENAIKIITKLVKQRRESAEIFITNARPELAEPALAEVVILETYLPKQMTEEELEAALKEIISTLGATSPQQMGQVMGAATKQLAGKADGKAISTKVKELLTK